VGFSMSEMMDPITGTQSTLLAQLFLMIATLIFVLMNGHLIMLRSLIESFGSVPLLSFHADQSVLDLLVTVLTSAFQVGIRMAGPTLVAIFLTTLTMGFISRTMPQLNILAVGFPLHIMLGMFVMIASMAMITAIMEDSILYALRQIGLLFL
jgi:flagellar biosynthesis protein FliR